MTLGPSAARACPWAQAATPARRRWRPSPCWWTAWCRCGSRPDASGRGARAGGRSLTPSSATPTFLFFCCLSFFSFVFPFRCFSFCRAPPTPGAPALRPALNSPPNAKCSKHQLSSAGRLCPHARGRTTALPAAEGGTERGRSSSDVPSHLSAASQVGQGAGVHGHGGAVEAKVHFAHGARLHGGGLRQVVPRAQLGEHACGAVCPEGSGAAMAPCAQRAVRKELRRT